MSRAHRNVVESSARPRTFVFDIVGTLTDEVGTVQRVVAEVLRLSDAESLAFAREWQAGLESEVDAVVRGERDWADYESLRSEALSGVLQERRHRPGRAQLKALRRVGCSLAAFPGAADELTALAESARVVGLTNSTLPAASAFSAAAGLRWHALLSADLVRAFKPQPEAYRFAIDALGLIPEECVFVAAHPWDLDAAKGFGFQTAYYPRPHADAPAASDAYDYTISSLLELVS